MWTTSRYASKGAREVAIQLSRRFSSPYVSRGKKNIHIIVELARKIGEERVFIVNEKNDKRSIDFIAVNELGEWSWLKDKVEINEE